MNSLPSTIRKILLFVALLVAFHCLSFAEQANLAKALIQAQAALDANQPQQAVEILGPFVRDHPADNSAHLLMAEAFTMLGRFAAAEEQYQTILKRSPDHYIALAGLGELYASAGQLQKAEPLLAHAVKHGQQEPQLRIEWAQVLARLHRFKDARTALTGVAPPEPIDQRIAYFRLKAAICSGLGDSASASKHMESALALRPEDAELQLATATAQLQSGKEKRAADLAQSLFTKSQNPEAGLILLQAKLASHHDVTSTLASLRAMRFPPQQELAYRQRLAEILISRGDFTDSVQDLNRAIELDPANPDLRFNLALAQFKSGATHDALQTALRAKELGDNADIESLLGDIQESLNDNLAAVKSYQAAAAMDPKSENHQLNLALEFIRHRNFEPAKLVLQQAEKTFPKSWRIQVALGMVEYFTGTKPEASEILLRAVDLAPQPAMVFRYLGDIELDESSAPDPAAMARLCSYATAHPEAAREQLYCGALKFHIDFASRDTSHADEIIRRLSSAAKALPDDAAPHCELGRAYAWLEKWQLAQDESELCTKLNPNSAQAHYRLSQIYHHTGQTERAREEIKLYKEASQRLAEENEQHENALKTFLYTIQNKTAEAE